VIEVVDETGKRTSKGTQDTEKSRGAEEKIKALERPHADAGELKKALSTSALLEERGRFWGKRGSACRGFFPEPFLLIILLNLATSYGMNLWNREIFDALEKRDSQTVLFLSMLTFHCS
jgi:ABC-type uncharacterized transport system fused permease/ATPase subunit